MARECSVAASASAAALLNLLNNLITPILFPAGGAVAVHLQLVAFDVIMVDSGQLLLQQIQGRFLELLDLAAAQAEEMVVVGVAVDMLVVPVAVAEIDFPDEAAIDQQRQGPIDGGLGDLGALAFELQIKLIYVKVAVDREDLPENLLALRGAPQPPSSNIILKYLEFGFHDFNGNVIEN
jgi:hypothetical protein